MTAKAPERHKLYLARGLGFALILLVTYLSGIGTQELVWSLWIASME